MNRFGALLAMSMSRTAFLLKLILALLLVFPAVQHAFAGESQTVEVWKDPYCGCCGAWAEHLKAAGFEVKTVGPWSATRVLVRMVLVSGNAGSHDVTSDVTKVLTVGAR